MQAHHSMRGAATSSRPQTAASNPMKVQAEVTTKFSVRQLSAWFGAKQVLHGITLDVPARHVTAIIGPSGCGKSTFIRCLNRMHELVPTASIKGQVYLDGDDIYSEDVDPVMLRRMVGMVFQKPNPFPKSIYDNVAYGLRVRGERNRGLIEGKVEQALRDAALWDEVKDRLRQPGTALSGGQQQRLCIARALATDPEMLLFDEPTSALDPIATASIEELISEMNQKVTVVIVTHNMQQAARVSDFTAFMYLGDLIEHGDTATIFSNPAKQQTEDYITGRFG